MFASLPDGPFDLIHADNPWRLKTNSAQKPGKNAMAHYQCHTVDELARLPVGDIAANDCVLWMWVTNPMLPQQLEILPAWGFKYKTLGTWGKYNHDTEKIAFGTGFRLRNATEHFVVATRGKPVTEKTVRSLILDRTQQHSRKPESAYAAAEALMPNARRIDLFGRKSRPGWTVWGNQATKFDGEGM